MLSANYNIRFFKRQHIHCFHELFLIIVFQLHWQKLKY